MQWLWSVVSLMASKKIIKRKGKRSKGKQGRKLDADERRKDGLSGTGNKFVRKRSRRESTGSRETPSPSAVMMV